MREKKQIFIAHSNTDVLGDVIDRFEDSGWKIVVCFNAESLLHQMEFRCPEAILLGEELVGGSSEKLCRSLRKNVLLDRIPIFMLSEGTSHSAELAEKMGGSVNGIVPMHRNPVLAYGELLKRFRSSRFDPVTGLATGSLVYRMLDHLCDDAPFSWTFLLVKLFGVRIYNFHTSYEEGDRMLGAVGELLEESLSEIGHATDFAARLRGSYFCVATRSRRVETMINKIMNQSTRVFRKFYTPFELVKGYITVEDEKAGGNYHMAELMIAGLQVSHRWQGHYAMLYDVSRELLGEVEKEEAGHKIVALK